MYRTPHKQDKAAILSCLYMMIQSRGSLQRLMGYFINLSKKKINKI